MKLRTVRSRFATFGATALLVFFYSNTAFSQCRGVIHSEEMANDRTAAPTCNIQFAGTTAKYKDLITFVPNINDPVITVKLVFHVFSPSSVVSHAFYNTNDPWNGLPGLQTMLNGYASNGFQNQTERYTAQGQYNSAQYVAFNPPTVPNGDSRLRYEVAAVYFYTSTALYNGGGSGCMSYINTNFPARLGEGLPIIMSSDCQYQSRFNSTVAGTIPYVAVCPLAGTDATSQANNNNFAISQLRHEIGHALGLLHTYYGDGQENPGPQIPAYPGNPSPSPETPMPKVINGAQDRSLDCNHTDFLWDVFPANNPNCALLVNNPPTSLCGSCYEEAAIPMYSNNVMSSGFNNWMSNLQMARRARAMHFIYNNNWAGVNNWANVRVFAKDMLSGHANPWLITGGVTESWEFDIQMYKDILVKAGNTLIIKCKVAMATDGKITVEKGARLIIDGGEVTGWCKTTPAGSNFNVPLWTGIEVAGNPAQNQLINNQTGYCANQGIVEVKNGGKITYAMKGINNSLTNPAGGGAISNTSGGIVIANGATFENNVFDIIFYKYQQGNVTSKIENSTFITNAKIGVDGNNAIIYPHEHIKLYENWGLNIKGCTFTYAAGGIYPGSGRGTGIYATDSHFTVDRLNVNTQTSFNGLKEGIYIDNGNPLFTASIRNSVFNNNEFGTKVENCNYLAFYNNTIQVPTYCCGVYLYRSKYYDVRNNTISGNGLYDGGVGVLAYDSKTGLHKFYRNTFSNLTIGIECDDDNGGGTPGTFGLKMNCNVFNSGQSNLEDIGLFPYLGTPIVMYEQSNNPVTSALDYVRNQYGAPYFPGSGFYNKWYINPGSVQPILHAGSTGGVDNPNAPFGQADPQVNVTTHPFAFNFQTHCLATGAVNGGDGNSRSEKLLAMNNNITNLRALGLAGASEIQATVASKLNLFLTDTLPDGQDSVVVILQNNQGGMNDADIQLVFAHLRNGNFGMAAEKKDNLPAAKADWKAMLGKISELKQHPDNIYGFFSDANNMNFMSSYANTEDKDGQACAQGLLSFMGVNHVFPILYPPMGNRIVGAGTTAKFQNGVRLYPNPADNGFTLENLDKEQGALTLVLMDVLGKAVLTQTVNNPDRHYVSLNGLSNGVYLLKVISDKQATVYESKIVKQR